MQSALIGCLSFTGNVDRFSHGVGQARWNNNDAMLDEGYPRPMSHSETARTPEHVVDGDRFERAECQPPATLNLANRECMQPNG